MTQRKFDSYQTGRVWFDLWWRWKSTVAPWSPYERAMMANAIDLNFNLPDDLELALRITNNTLAYFAAEMARTGKSEREILEAHIAKRGKTEVDIDALEARLRGKLHGG